MTMKIVSNFPSKLVIWLFIMVNTTSFMSSTTQLNMYDEKKIGCHLEMSYYGGITAEIGKLQLINASIANLATDLTTSLSGEDPTFSLIQNKVAPVLLEALTTKARSNSPKSLQASFIGINGVFFSYFASGDGITAVYSNTTLSSSSYTWYTQSVSEAGKLVGEAEIGDPSDTAMYAEIFLRAENVKKGYTSIGRRWCGSEAEILVIHTVFFEQLNGAVSIGFPIEEIAEGDGERMMFETVSKKSADRGDDNGDFVDDERRCRFEDAPSSSLMDVWKNMLKLEVNLSAVTYHSLVDMIEKHGEEMLALSVAMAVAFTVSAFSSAYLTVKFAKKKMEFYAQLSKHMEAAKQAERKAMMKSKAVATASHDVRAALSGISSLIENSYCKTVPGSDLEISLRQMDSCAKDLLDLLNDILDSSKIEAGKMQLAEAEFDLPKLLKDSVDIFRPVGMKKGVDVVLDPCDGSLYKYPIVKGDRIKLKQVICNLLSNAIKFTAEGRVSLRVWARKPILDDSRGNTPCTPSSSLFFWKPKKMDDPGNEESKNRVKRDPNCMEYVIEVDDTGKGIPKDEWKTVFENYMQVKETAALAGGTGLGLGIVQSLVRLMGGDVEIVDKPFGQSGTCFKLNIFLTSCANHIDVREFNAMGDKKNAATEEIHVIPTTPLDGKKVLIAEDNNMLMLVAGKILTKMGAVVEKCHNGQEAVDLVHKGLKDQLLCGSIKPPYDYILMDCEMPLLDGREATRLIRKEETQYDLHIPVIALTAHTADREQLDKLYEAGMDLYLQKPLQEAKLMAAIRTIERGKCD